MLKKILIGIGVIIVLFLIVVAMQPSDFLVTRTATISAPASTIFAQINDLHNWEAWSPWAKMDPAMKQTYEGATVGTGASYFWKGNSKVGEGRMTIMESRPSDMIKIKLEFIKPFSATNDTDFTFKPEGNQTNVTWSMSGKNNFIGKAFCMFMNMDKTVGGDFEKGLMQLKSIVEAGSKK